VKIQDGCRNACTFCIVTVARGEERSRTIDAVVEEVRRQEDEGYQEVVLTGVHIGGYGHDQGTTLSALLEALLARTGIGRIRVGSLEPWDLPRGFFGAWADGRLCPHLHLPLQSGSGSVLRRMARRCSPDSFATLVEEARAAIPELNVSTDVIVGFPGETEAEWAETMAFVEAVGFGQLHIFGYSRREGTRAARLAGGVSGEVIRERSRELHGLGASMRAAFLGRQVGAARRVLWEGVGTPVGDGSAVWTGYTENYARTTARAPVGEALRTSVWPVRILGSDGESLTAERLVEGSAG